MQYEYRKKNRGRLVTSIL